MEQTPLEIAAEKYCNIPRTPIGSITYTRKTEAFKAGAEWQKEQTKQVLIELEASILSSAGADRPYERAMIKKAINDLNK